MRRSGCKACSAELGPKAADRSTPVRRGAGPGQRLCYPEGGGGEMTAMNPVPDQARSPTDAPSRLAAVRREIAQACAGARRDPAGVTLVAVSKTFGAAAIAP